MSIPRRVGAVAAALVYLPVAAHAEPPAARPATSAAPAAHPAPSAPVPAAPAAATPVAPPPDLVLLKNGGMVRGTISELVPNDAVTIITAGGATKRIAMSEVSYAGPADKATSTSPKEGAGATADKPTEATAPERDATRPFITVQGKGVPFKFSSQETNLTLHMQTGSAEAMTWMGTPTGITAVGYTPVCSAPCSATVPAGAHQFALSKDNGRPVSTPNLTNLSEPSVLEGVYHSNQGTRTAGWVVAIGGIVGGLVLVSTGFSKSETPCPSSDPYCVPHTEYDFTNVYLGIGLAGIGGLVGMLLARTSDGADLTVRPQAASASK